MNSFLDELIELVNETQDELKVIQKKQKLVLSLIKKCKTSAKKAVIPMESGCGSIQRTVIPNSKLAQLLGFPEDEEQNRRDIFNGINEYIISNSLKKEEAIVMNDELFNALELKKHVSLDIFNIQSIVNKVITEVNPKITEN